MIMAKTNDPNAINPDSVRNCPIKLFLCEPNVFLMPTSFDLFKEWAVVRFIKFTLANTRRINAIAPSI